MTLLFLGKRILTHMAIRCKKRRISFLSEHSLYLVLGEEVRGEGRVRWLKAPRLKLSPHFDSSRVYQQIFGCVNCLITRVDISRATMSVNDV